MLEDAGLVQRRNGRLEVTPRGARKMGERALTRVFERLAARPRGHPRGARPGRSGRAHRPDAPVALRGSRHDRGAANRVQCCDARGCPRRSDARGCPRRRGSVRLDPDDFELIEAEQRTETATALLLDLSFSMPLRGHLVHAKKMALALHALIEGRYPHDTLYLIGFSDFARQLQPQDLAAPGFERTYGTNMQHAFLLAGRLLAQHPRANRQVIMVTDGEPTAHLEGEQAFFAWPPEPETIRLTLAEAVRLARSGVTLNIFMLEESEGLTRFMERLAERTGGRVFLMDDGGSAPSCSATTCADAPARLAAVGRGIKFAVWVVVFAVCAAPVPTSPRTPTPSHRAWRIRGAIDHADERVARGIPSVDGDDAQPHRARLPRRWALRDRLVRHLRLPDRCGRGGAGHRHRTPPRRVEV